MHHPRARNLRMRIDLSQEQLLITVPPMITEHRINEFLESALSWVKTKLPTTYTGRVPFKIGNTIPIHGKPRMILSAPQADQVVSLSSNSIIVSGNEEFIGRRLNDWLKKESHSLVTDLTLKYAAQISQRVRKVLIQDCKGRWGSCSSSRELRYSWRLIMAPIEVLEYICAHEVAHLKHMNHSKSFWAVVQGLDPDYEAARCWLKQHGKSLFLYG